MLCFPVVYMLHGAGGNHRSMPGDGVIAGLSDRHGFIAVCPDGAVTSWWIDSPIDPTLKYETFVSKELPAYMDANYSRSTPRTGRSSRSSRWRRGSRTAISTSSPSSEPAISS